MLESAAGPEADTAASPRLVVIDDAHELPPSTLRMIDSRLNEAPLDMRLLLLSRWDLPLTKLVPELLGYSTTLRGELLRIDPAESAALAAPATLRFHQATAPTIGFPSVIRSFTRPQLSALPEPLQGRVADMPPRTSR